MSLWGDTVSLWGDTVYCPGVRGGIVFVRGDWEGLLPVSPEGRGCEGAWLKGHSAF